MFLLYWFHQLMLARRETAVQEGSLAETLDRFYLYRAEDKKPSIAALQLNFRVHRGQFCACVINLHLPVDATLGVVDVSRRAEELSYYAPWLRSRCPNERSLRTTFMSNELVVNSKANAGCVCMCSFALIHTECPTETQTTFS